MGTPGALKPLDLHWIEMMAEGLTSSDSPFIPHPSSLPGVLPGDTPTPLVAETRSENHPDWLHL